ncbi:hypothetical protein KR222_010837 [Zaprionus bogoriensis]|nr:hypothetical protein KR222_010837 [Zaprionus bogoriensis]
MSRTRATASLLRNALEYLYEINLRTHLIISALLRFTLICYAQLHDAKSTVPYTDIDYKVVTDGARFVLAGETPFARHTYRYSPIMAYIQIPNILLHPAFGKVVYSLFDLLVGVLIHGVVRMQLQTSRDKSNLEKMPRIATCCWLYNPLTAVISTRGSGDSFASFFVILTIYLLIRAEQPTSRSWSIFCAGLAHGLVIHLRLYPLFFSLAYYLCLSSGSLHKPRDLLPNRQQLCLVLGTILALGFFTCTFYALYGWQYLHEAYLYHLVRKDVRHNFSLHFLMQYLASSEHVGESTLFVKFLVLAPQLLLVFYLSFSFGQFRQTLPFGVFALAFVVVTYNSVVTSQYFVWYLAVLPLCLLNFRNLSARRCAVLIAIWIVGQALWLLPAYLLEFQTWHTFNWIGLQSAVFFIINSYILAKLIQGYDCRPLKTNIKKY